MAIVGEKRELIEIIDEYLYANDSWFMTFNLFKKYITEYGKISNKPTFYYGVDIKSWINDQIKKCWGNELSIEKIELLESIPGWSWNMGKQSASEI